MGKTAKFLKKYTEKKEKKFTDNFNKFKIIKAGIKRTNRRSAELKKCA